MATGNGPRMKPWERTGSASGAAPFRPPSNGNTSDVVEASGTAKPGEMVSTLNQTTVVPTNTVTRPGPRTWEQNYGNNSYGGYGSNSSMFGGSYGGGGYGSGSYSSGMYGGGYGSGYGGNMYGNSMINSGYGTSVGYGGYSRPMGYNGGMNMGMGMGMVPGMNMGIGNPDDPNNPFGPPAEPPGFWVSFLRVMSGVVQIFGRITELVYQNTQAFHMFMSALLQLFDRSGALYGELARFILRLLGIRTPPRKNIDGKGPPSIPGPKANNSGNSWQNDWDDFAKGQ